MATVLRTTNFRPLPCSPVFVSFTPPKTLCLSFGRRYVKPHCISRHFSNKPSSVKFVPSAVYGEAIEADKIKETDFQESSNGAVDGESEGKDGARERENAEGGAASSALTTLLQSYKEALAHNDESRIAELEASIKSMEEEKTSLELKVATLSEELTLERDKILRISADFDNFRKRTTRERLSLITNAEGEVVENLLPVLDSFERAKAQIKAETEGEQKINNSYQSIYKQFVELLGAIGVSPVETIGKPFDPLLHEAILREDSAEFEEGVIIEEFRRGFRLEDRLLRPAMVKVSAGPGPTKPEATERSEQESTAEENEKR